MEDITVKDLFAGMAMIGLLAKSGYSAHVAMSAYHIAELMVKEKEKRDAHKQSR